MSGSSLDLLLRVAGGGKRARGSVPVVSKDEKLAYMKQTLTMTRNKLKESALPLHNLMLKHVDDAIERMSHHTDGEYIKQGIAKMGLARVTELKQRTKAAQLSERAMHQLSASFFEESEALETLSGSIDQMISTLGVLFSIQMILSFWNGEMNFTMFRSLIDDRIKVLEILREHGVMADA